MKPQAHRCHFPGCPFVIRGQTYCPHHADTAVDPDDKDAA